jgi:hypothetical protein
MALTTREKKQVWAKLRESLDLTDSIYIPLDEDPSKTKILERIAIILSGHAAQLGMLLEQLSYEIEGDIEAEKIMREFKQLYSDEVNRGKPSQPIPEEEDYEDDESGEELI